MKKLLIILATLGLVAHMTGCTGGSTEEDSAVVENADVDKIDAETSSATVAEDQSMPSTDDSSLQAALGGDTATAPQVDSQAVAQAPDELSLDAASTEITPPDQNIAAAPSLDENSLNEIPSPTMDQAPTQDVAKADSSSQLSEPLFNQQSPIQDPIMAAPAPEVPLADNSATSMAPSVDSAPVFEAPVQSSVSSSIDHSTPAVASAKPAAPAKRISETTPYQHGDNWVNTVYIVRPKETLKAISAKIYNTDKSKELKAINSFLKARSPQAGDKIFYVSPNRPMDSTKMISFYEDSGMIPETYVAKNGDNLKKVAKKLLGYDKAWKEVWATNNLDSQTKLKEGDAFRYWSAPATIDTTVAMNQGNSQLIDSPNQLPQAPAMNTPPPAPHEMQAPPPPPMPEPAPHDMGAAPPPGQAELPPPPGQAELPPPPPQDQMAPPPPPPPPQEMAQAPQAPKKAPAQPSMEEEAPAEGPDMMMLMGIAIVVCGVIAIIMIKRKKRKEAELAAMSEHNVGT